MSFKSNIPQAGDGIIQSSGKPEGSGRAIAVSVPHFDRQRAAEQSGLEGLRSLACTENQLSQSGDWSACAGYNEEDQMSNNNVIAQDIPLDAFIEEMAICGFDWVKRIGHVNVHIFEHTVTHEVMPIPVERNVVRAPYV